VLWFCDGRTGRQGQVKLTGLVKRLGIVEFVVVNIRKEFNQLLVAVSYSVSDLGLIDLSSPMDCVSKVLQMKITVTKQRQRSTGAWARVELSVEDADNVGELSVGE
jgi:hypothetical protein